MPTPEEGYRLKNGTRVPGTTTITGRYKDSGALMDWVWKQGVAGVPWRETRDKAGAKGTKIHLKLEKQFHTDPVVPWPGLQHLRILRQEVQLVSEVYEYGGTLDAIGIDLKGRYVLLDWKTSKSFYTEHLLQMAAYNNIWNENYPGLRITGGTYIVRFTKSGNFVEYIAFDVPEILGCPTLALAWAQFKDAVRMYARETPLKEDKERAEQCLKIP